MCMGSQLTQIVRENTLLNGCLSVVCLSVLGLSEVCAEQRKFCMCNLQILRTIFVNYAQILCSF